MPSPLPVRILLVVNGSIMVDLEINLPFYVCFGIEPCLIRKLASCKSLFEWTPSITAHLFKDLLIRKQFAGRSCCHFDFRKKWFTDEGVIC